MEKTRELKGQFNIRSEDFNRSANWISDRNLINAHVELSGDPKGEALDLCCGTGMIGRALQESGWDVKGLDISEEMVQISSEYFEVFEGSAENMPFSDNTFNLVVCRQTFQFLNAEKVLSEVARVLIPGGVFVIGLTVPFSDVDKDWLCNIHNTKQPLLKIFYTSDGLVRELNNAGFEIKKIKNLEVRESIANWMKYAPELSEETKEKVITMVKKAPATYRELHKVEVQDGDVKENWNWIILKAFYSKNDE